MLLAAHPILLLTLLTEDVLAESLGYQSTSLRFWLEALSFGLGGFLNQGLFDQVALSAALSLTELSVAVHLTAHSGLETCGVGIAVAALDTANALLTWLAHIELLLLWLLLTHRDCLDSKLLEL